MKKILGLDLGVGSIGWSLIEVNNDNSDNNRIIDMGVRVIPLTIDETTGFTKGNGETACSQRTARRSLRRGMDRYQQRRASLAYILDTEGMKFDDNLLRLSPMELWQLRADAARGAKLSLPEIGRIIYHINQRRGYKPAKGDDKDSSSSEYLSAINNRAKEAASENMTPGQYFAAKLKESEYTTPSGGKGYSYRIKEKVFPRKAYYNELITILNQQQLHYPEILTDDVIQSIAETVFYQRPLKSCKHLVSICEFEAREYVNANGVKVISGPKVAPVSSPLFQVCRLWEAINNITIKNYHNKRKSESSRDSLSRLNSFEYVLTRDERNKIFTYLNDNEKLTTKDLFKILGLKNSDGFTTDKAVVKGIKGNVTKNELAKALENLPDAEKYLRFNLEMVETGKVDEVTGKFIMKISDSYLREPLYKLWHTLYSIDEYDTLKTVLENKFGITDPLTIDNLFKLDFRGKGYGNKSSKFMCRIIPFLMEGYKYSEACEMVEINHSNSLTKEENEARTLIDQLPLINKGELRQPVVEKILNQLIHLINDLLNEYGRPDEINIELARSLKQSKEERYEESKRNNARERENKEIADKILNEWNLRPSVNKIQKYRMWLESEHCCMYCGKPVGAKEFLLGINAEKEHIIPRSLFFDDSFSNKVCSCRECNASKGQKTGYDFMKEKGDDAFSAYIERVERLFNAYKSSRGKSGISKTKHDRLLTSRKEIPQDFIERDLRQSQYIARKAMELLKQVCRTVYATTGSVTDFFRHVWGYDEILHVLNLPRYSAAGQTEIVEYQHRDQTHEKEIIEGWTKRLDHRHHAIDALTIALTRRAYIQRLNTLNTLRDAAFQGTEEQSSDFQAKMQNFEKWASEQPHFCFDEAKDAVSAITVSFKSGKKVSTPGKRIVYKGGKRIVAQTGIQVPRGPLTEESVYGTIKSVNKNVPVKKLFENPELIINRRIRSAVESRLAEYGMDIDKAVGSLKKKPLRPSGFKYDIKNADCWKPEFVIRYNLSSIKFKNIDDIVDKGIRNIVRQRFAEVGNDDKKFIASLNENPLFLDREKRIPINSVRCYTGLNPDSMTPISHDENGKPIGFSKYGNNHHIAIYINQDGKPEECVVPMFHAVKRKHYGLPIVVTDPVTTWLQIENMDMENENELLSRFPLPSWKFFESLQINDMFILGLSDDEINYLLSNHKYEELNAHIFRVQRLTSGIYEFKRHDCTLSDTKQAQIDNGNYIRIQSFKRYKELNPRKIKVSRLGKITLL